jgi:lipopolysaccharide assembly outer membrane protein LptD (OstA)
VAFGATNVPLPRKLLATRLQWLFILFLMISLGEGVFSLLCPPAFALGENQPIHFSGDKQLWDRKANRVELIGHGAVNQLGETLTADYILLDQNARTLDARGNCVYVAKDSIIYGEEMHFNLDTRTGTVIGGRISNDFFTLRGERINKLGPGRFQTHWGDYTTCKDCAASWSLQGEDVDMQVDGYASLYNVTTKVKDAPAAWLPYLIIPMKTRRQSGILFPTIGSGDYTGPTFVLPFFWAINRSTDMTIGLGEYVKKGHRIEWEGRYDLGNSDTGKANIFVLTDTSFAPYTPFRYAINIDQAHQFPWGIDEKLKFTELSDNIYPFYFPNDVPHASGEAFLPSSLIFAKSAPDFTLSLGFQRNRNLISSYPTSAVVGQLGNQNAQQVVFDPRTVQLLPTINATLHDRQLWGTNIIGGVSSSFSYFTRPSGAFDFDYTNVPFGMTPPTGAIPMPGVDPIRKAMRLTLNPEIYTTLRLFDIISVVPQLQYRSSFYNFEGNMPNLGRGYLLFQTDFLTQIEKVFEFPDDPKIPRTKHLIRPILTYSLIPYIQGNENDPNVRPHPFVQQITQPAKFAPTPQAGQPPRGYVPGYNFDDNDIVPYTYQASSANYFVPLGNSLTYGLLTQWVRRRSGLSDDNPVYQTAIEFSAGQAVNFLELTNPLDPSNPHVFSRLFSTLNLTYDKFSSATAYYYYPDIWPVSSRNTISSSLSYIFERSVHQHVLNFDRSFTVNYTFNNINGTTSTVSGTLNFSLNDYIQPFLSTSYAFEPNSQYLGASGGVQLQSPSRCWRFTTYGSFLPGGLASPGGNFSYSFDLSFNFAGAGFGGITDFASQIVSH